LPKPHALGQKTKLQVNSKGCSHIISQMTFLEPVDLLQTKNGYNFSSVCGRPLILSKISTSREDGHLMCKAPPLLSNESQLSIHNTKILLVLHAR
jgi:hypothetical protein